MLRSLGVALRSAIFTDTVCFEKVNVLLLFGEHFTDIILEELALDSHLL